MTIHKKPTRRENVHLSSLFDNFSEENTMQQTILESYLEVQLDRVPHAVSSELNPSLSQLKILKSSWQSCKSSKTFPKSLLRPGLALQKCYSLSFSFFFLNKFLSIEDFLPLSLLLDSQEDKLVEEPSYPRRLWVEPDTPAPYPRSPAVGVTAFS